MTTTRNYPCVSARDRFRGSKSEIGAFAERKRFQDGPESDGPALAGAPIPQRPRVPESGAAWPQGGPVPGRRFPRWRESHRRATQVPEPRGQRQPRPGAPTTCGNGRRVQSWVSRSDKDAKRGDMIVLRAGPRLTRC